MRQAIEVMFAIVACGVLAWCCWGIWSVDRDLGALKRRDEGPGPIPDAEIDYDHVTLADVRRMSDEQLWRGYEHTLRREREARVGGR